ncbi:MAG: YgjV family protein [Stomatobaculum sp.]|nr:YgjV family protein [Stomatobaculum sp.]
MYTILTQLVGFAGTALVIGAFQIKDTKRMMYVHALAALFFTLHFLMLRALGGAFSQFLYMANIFLLNDTKHGFASWKGWKHVVSALLALMTVCTWQGPISLIPCFASIANTYANWSRNGKVIRLNRLCFASPLWILYDALVGSVSGIVCEAFSIGSILVSLFRYGLAALDG